MVHCLVIPRSHPPPTISVPHIGRKEGGSQGAEGAQQAEHCSRGRENEEEGQVGPLRGKPAVQCPKVRRQRSRVLTLLRLSPPPSPPTPPISSACRSLAPRRRRSLSTISRRSQSRTSKGDPPSLPSPHLHLCASPALLGNERTHEQTLCARDFEAISGEYISQCKRRSDTVGKEKDPASTHHQERLSRGNEMNGWVAGTVRIETERCKEPMNDRRTSR